MPEYIYIYLQISELYFEMFCVAAAPGQIDFHAY